MKILVTGSRGWKDREKIRDDLLMYHLEANAMGEELVVIHGDCPKGADRLADQACRELGIRRIREPAKWERYGRSAGPKRNQLMLDKYQPDLTLAYRATGKSGGTDDMVKRSRDAGVQTIVCNAPRTPHSALRGGVA